MDDAQDSRVLVPAGAVVTQPDSAWSFAAHISDSAPFLLGWAVALLVVLLAAYGLAKAGPPILRLISNSNDSIASAAATFESLEASMTAAISAHTDQVKRLIRGVKLTHAKVNRLEKKIDALMANADE